MWTWHDFCICTAVIHHWQDYLWPWVTLAWLLYNLQLQVDDVRGNDFENSLHSFGQSEKRYWVECIMLFNICYFEAVLWGCDIFALFLGDSGPAQHSDGKNSAGVFVSLFVVILLIIIVMVIVARKWIYTRRENSEKADFDFRDEDTASLSSLDLYGKRSCFPKCKLWGSSTRKEYVPLRIQAGEYKRYTL